MTSTSAISTLASALSPGDVPWIVSVDDHVIEPPSLWTSRLPARGKGIGPRVERLPAGELALAGARYVERPGTDGPLVDYWVYEDLFQSLKRAVAAADRKSVV